MPDQRELLRAALDEFHVTDPSLRAGIAAITLGESGFQPRTETGWSHTANQRIRDTFGERVANLDDAALSNLKADDVAFFNWVYGGTWGAKNLGNTQLGDGFRYRGRGDNQLTGRSNYAHFGQRLGIDLIGNPDLANDPTTAARLNVAYMLDRLPHGGGWEAMKRAVGNAVPATEAVKDAAYARFMQTGEFGASAPAAPIYRDDPAAVAEPSEADALMAQEQAAIIGA